MPPASGLSAASASSSDARPPGQHAAGELNRRVVDEHTRQRRGRVVGAGDLDAVLSGTGDLQHDAVGAAFQLLEDDLIGRRRIGLDDALMDLPAEVLHFAHACRA